MVDEYEVWVLLFEEKDKNLCDYVVIDVNVEVL